MGDRVWALDAITHRSDIGRCRRRARSRIRDPGLAASVSLILTELGSNLIKYATGGRILQGPGMAPNTWEIIAIDDGPGFAELKASLQDGVSSSGSMGSGLGAVARHASSFEIFSEDRTTVFVRVGGVPESPVAVQLVHPDHDRSGDVWVALPWRRSVRFAVFDGGGHGPAAATVAEKAVSVVRDAPEGVSLERVLSQVHQVACSSPRAIVGGIFDLRPGSVRWVSIGLPAVIARTGGEVETLPCQAGLLGRDAPQLVARTVSTDPEDTFAVWTDGIETFTPRSRLPGALVAEAVRGVIRRSDSLVVAVPLQCLSRASEFSFQGV